MEERKIVSILTKRNTALRCFYCTIYPLLHHHCVKQYLQRATHSCANAKEVSSHNKNHNLITSPS